MRVGVEICTDATAIGASHSPEFSNSVQWVLAFGAKAVLQQESWQAAVRQRYPQALLTGCSTAGEILGARLLSDSLVLAAVSFASTSVKGAMELLDQGLSSFEVGRRLGQSLAAPGLRHVFVLSDGSDAVDSSALIGGLTQGLPPKVSCTGGLAGGGHLLAPTETMVFCNGAPQERAVVAVGFYGEKLHVGYGSFSGWAPFGPDRLITKSKGRVLYELDGQSALTLYKKYLGHHANGLPLTGLYFPLSVRPHLQDQGVVRAVACVNEADQSITFSGDMPENAYARLMYSNAERVLDGASLAAWLASDALKDYSNKLSVLISCAGRQFLLQRRTEEEIENVAGELGEGSSMIGFYSFGELCPLGGAQTCALHNLTMTITTFAEEP